MDGLNRKMRRMDKSKKAKKRFKWFDTVSSNGKVIGSSLSDTLYFDIGGHSQYINSLGKKAANQSRKRK